uniref:SCAN box domain-containing protein n=1 Tax=Cyprinus carpio TaxID=7962 RepID=A0A8C2FDI9_CYPCA
MDFDLISFTLSPTTEEFNRCRKKDLLLIADFFNIEIPREAIKKVIKDELFEKLVSEGILPREYKEVIEEVQDVAGETIDQELPLDSKSVASCDDPKMALKLKELDLSIRKQECEAQRIRLRAIEIQADRDIRLRQLDLQAQQMQSKPVPLPRSRAPSGTSPVQSPNRSMLESQSGFDVSKNIALVPKFRESEVDSYFTAFERVAANLKWPKEMWALLLQCSLVGKAQEVSSALPIEQSLDYDIVKSAVLRTYELVPEAYRQKFRNLSKTVNQTFVEFAREKKNHFEKWCLSSKVNSFEQLQELLLLEDFKRCIPEKIVVHLNEKRVVSLQDAAVICDEFVLTHKQVFSSPRPTRNLSFRDESRERGMPKTPHSYRNDMPVASGRSPVAKLNGDGRVCFYCLDPSHLISECKAWKQKNSAAKTKSIAFVQSASSFDSPLKSKVYEPFILNGSVSLSVGSDYKPIQMLRDTGSAQSLILKSALSFSSESYTGESVLIQGIELGCVKVPLHQVHLKSDLVEGPVKIAVCSQLPVKGISLILGNDLAGGKVFPCPVVTDVPTARGSNDIAEKFPSVFPVCAVTRAQARKYDDVVELSDSFLIPQSEPVEVKLSIDPELFKSDLDVLTEVEKIPLTLGREQLAIAQKSDPTLSKCIS